MLACLNRYSPADPFHSRFQNVTAILPNLVPDVKFWENSITLKKGKKNQRKNLCPYKKISSNQNPTNLKYPMSRSDHYLMQLDKDLKAKSKTISCAPC